MKQKENSTYWISLVNDILKTLLPPGQDPLFKAAHYSLAGGKRIRPILTLAVIETFDRPIERAFHPAAALEMLHTYSLIHDDLPCMDDDDFRRGKPSLHKAYPESHAILTGDLLLTSSFEALANAPDLTEAEKIALIQILALRSGHLGMIGGQRLDMESKELTLDLDSIKKMYCKKTGALITASLEFGAILSKQEIAPFQKLGEILGFAFQVVDDLLDEDGIVSVIGKEKAQLLALDLHEEAQEIISSFNVSAPLLEDLARQLIFRNQ